MGIAGLLDALKRCMKPVHLKIFNGCTIGIDGYGWLHRGSYSCASDLCRGIPTTKYLDFCMRRVEMLRHFGITPVIVFDGRPLLMKRIVNDDRKYDRKENLKKGLAFYHAGDKVAAFECFSKAVSVTPDMVHEFVKLLESRGVKFIIAPNEADAQLVYLEETGQIDGIITEDSDLVTFGGKRIFFKLDDNGDGQLFEREKLFEPVSDLPKAPGPAVVRKRRKGPLIMKFTGWSEQKFRRLCIMSGSDYLPSLPKMGLKTAYKFIIKMVGDNMDRVWIAIAMDEKFNLTVEYIELFNKAEITFMHQLVYNPITRTVIPRHPYPADTYTPVTISPLVLRALNRSSSAIERRHSLSGEAMRVMAEQRSQLSSQSRSGESSIISAVSGPSKGPSPLDGQDYDESKYEFAGKPFPSNKIAQDVCEGRVNPVTFLPFESDSNEYKTNAKTAVSSLKPVSILPQASGLQPIFKSKPGRRSQSAPFSVTDLPVNRNLGIVPKHVVHDDDIIRGAKESAAEFFRDFSDEKGKEEEVPLLPQSPIEERPMKIELISSKVPKRHAAFTSVRTTTKHMDTKDVLADLDKESKDETSESSDVPKMVFSAFKHQSRKRKPVQTTLSSFAPFAKKKSGHRVELI